VPGEKVAPIAERDVIVADAEHGDITFRVLESGPADAATLLWLHGSGPGANARTNWEWQLGALGDEFHNVAPDIVGFGESTHPEHPPLGVRAFTELRVRTLLALLDQLGLERVTLVGNSMGAIISLALTLTAPGRVERLVLMGGGGAPIGLTPELLKLVTFYENPTTEAMADLMSCFVADPAFFGDDLQQIAVARMPMALRPEVERSHRATFAPGEPLSFPPDALATITQPVLVVHGEDDRLIPIAAGEYFAEHLPNVRFERFANTGHWLMIEQAQPFADLVRKFLDATAG
jgi:2-hydroxymuconate-semialdehyde hydrolase